MKNNKLIAEFMGEIDQDTGEYSHLGEWFYPEDCKFHKSWDWLMSVVEKILDISFQDEGDGEDFYSIRDCIPDINHTYKAVVEFIKEYNKIK